MTDEVLELMQIIDEHKEEIVTLQSKLNAADEDELTEHLTDKLNDHTKQLEILNTKEIALKTATCNILSQRNIAAKSTNDVISSLPDPEISFDTHTEPTKVEHRPQSRFKFKLPPPDKFKRGDNFSRFCNNFLDYSKLACLDIYFLTLLDSFTKDKLKGVRLTEKQKKDARMFTAAYIKKMTPEHEAESLELKLLDEKQSNKESIEDFSFRLTESVEEPSRKSACYSTFLKGLTNKDIRIRLREDRNVKKFDSAVEEAARLHDIRESENQTPEPVITEPVNLWKVEEDKSQTNHPRLGERSHSPAN